MGETDDRQGSRSDGNDDQSANPNGGIYRYGSTNYYEYLGVSEDVDKKTVGQKYREHIQEYHPDNLTNNADDGELVEARTRLRHSMRAEETLTDPESRARYDDVGHVAYVNEVYDMNLGIGDQKEIVSGDPTADTDPEKIPGVDGISISTDEAYNFERVRARSFSNLPSTVAQNFRTAWLARGKWYFITGVAIAVAVGLAEYGVSLPDPFPSGYGYVERLLTVWLVIGGVVEVIVEYSKQRDLNIGSPMFREPAEAYKPLAVGGFATLVLLGLVASVRPEAPIASYEVFYTIANSQTAEGVWVTEFSASSKLNYALGVVLYAATAIAVAALAHVVTRRLWRLRYIRGQFVTPILWSWLAILPSGAVLIALFSGGADVPRPLDALPTDAIVSVLPNGDPFAALVTILIGVQFFGVFVTVALVYIAKQRDMRSILTEKLY